MEISDPNKKNLVAEVSTKVTIVALHWCSQVYFNTNKQLFCVCFTVCACVCEQNNQFIVWDNDTVCVSRKHHDLLLKPHSQFSSYFLFQILCISPLIPRWLEFNSAAFPSTLLRRRWCERDAHATIYHASDS